MSAAAAPRPAAAANDAGRRRVLLVHDRFPGQFGHLAADLAVDPTIELRFLAGHVEGSVVGDRPARSMSTPIPISGRSSAPCSTARPPIAG